MAAKNSIRYSKTALRKSGKQTVTKPKKTLKEVGKDEQHWLLDNLRSQK